MEILKIIHIFVDAIKKDLSYKYNTYIQDIYDKTKIVVNDYFEILNKTKHFLESHQKTLDEIIEFLEDERVDFRVIRCEIRAVAKTDTFYLQDTDYANFMRGVLGVLQGGLESEVLTDRGIDNVYHNHTINDIIEECKIRNKFKNNSNIIELNSELIDAVNEQEEELKKSWELVCESYVKINDHLLNRL